jgi:hypothetical protein
MLLIALVTETENTRTYPALAYCSVTEVAYSVLADCQLGGESGGKREIPANFARRSIFVVAYLHI